MADVNKLASMVAMSARDLERVQQAAVSIAPTLSRDALVEAKKECGGMEVASFSDAISLRLGSLAGRVLQRFPQPADLLSISDKG